MRLRPGYPVAEGELAIIDRFISDNPLEALSPVASAEEILEAQKSFVSVQVSAPVRRYIVSLTEATRTPPDVVLGVSPRGMLWMLRASQALAAISGRTYVLPDDVKRLAVPVFAHRIITRSGYSAAGRAEEVIRELLKSVAVPSEDPTADRIAD
jgi:MoxR-like ATPase